MTDQTALFAGPMATSRRPPRGLRVASAAVVGAVLLLAVVGPLVWPDHSAQDLSRYLVPPGLEEPLGRDHLGRDVAARLAHATRLSLVLAALGVGTALLLGCAAGVAAAWTGGWIDAVLRWLSEAFMALPALLIVLLFSAMADGGIWTLYVGLALAQWVEYFRLVRARAGIVLAGPAVEAARLLGLGPVHVLRRHLWPELRGLLTTLATLGTVTTVLALSTLGFVGVGIQPPTPELGQMVTEAFPYYDEAPWMSLAPVAVLVLLTAGLLGLRRTEEMS